MIKRLFRTVVETFRDLCGVVDEAAMYDNEPAILLINEVSKVYDVITDGQIKNPYTPAKDVLQAFYDNRHDPATDVVVTRSVPEPPAIEKSAITSDFAEASDKNGMVVLMRDDKTTCEDSQVGLDRIDISALIPMPGSSKLFVLRFDNDKDARAALLSYAYAIRTKAPYLSQKIRNRLCQYTEIRRLAMNFDQQDNDFLDENTVRRVFEEFNIPESGHGNGGPQVFLRYYGDRVMEALGKLINQRDDLKGATESQAKTIELLRGQKSRMMDRLKEFGDYDFDRCL